MNRGRWETVDSDPYAKAEPRARVNMKRDRLNNRNIFVMAFQSKENTHWWNRTVLDFVQKSSISSRQSSISRRKEIEMQVRLNEDHPYLHQSSLFHHIQMQTSHRFSSPMNEKNFFFYITKHIAAFESDHFGISNWFFVWLDIVFTCHPTMQCSSMNETNK